jgi:hypothetical protein
MNISTKLMFTTSRQFLPYLREGIKFSRIYNISYRHHNGTPGSCFFMARDKTTTQSLLGYQSSYTRTGY